MKIIAGKYYSRALEVPKNKTTRPSTSRLRESLFNILQLDIEGADFLDIFAGSGAIGIEALSRGAKRVTFIENDRAALHVLNSNIKKFGVEAEAVVLSGDYSRSLESLGKRGAQFDIIFADAPYHADVTESLIRLIKENNLLKKGGKLFIENDQPLKEIAGLAHVNSRKTGKSYLHQFIYEL